MMISFSQNSEINLRCSFMVFKRIYNLLDFKQRKSIIFLFTLSFSTAILEVAGVASILPFMGILANPDIVSTNRGLAYLYQLSGSKNFRDFAILLGFLMFGLIVVSTSVKLLAKKFQVIFLCNLEHNLSLSLLRGYLNNEYKWFLFNHSGKLNAVILNEVSQFIDGVVLPILILFIQIPIAFFITALLIYVDPWPAFLMGVSVSSLYLLIYWRLRLLLVKVGNKSFAYQKKKFEMLAEIFSCIKEVKVASLEKFFVEKYANVSALYSFGQTYRQFIKELPRFILEILAFGGIIVVTLYLLLDGKNSQEILPILSLYAICGYKLIPALNSIYSNYTTFKFNYSIVQTISEGVNAEIRGDELNLKDTKKEQAKLDGVNIDLRDISFSFSQNSFPIINHISMTIPGGSQIGLMGATGSGKTTLIDLVTGLLSPSQGEIFLNGNSMKSYGVANWRASCGYVQQSTFLLDDTIRNNIAFGIESSNINEDLLAQVCRIAQLEDFVNENSYLGYDSLVGEKGVRLSGGQRQRIAIARALYRRPDVLIMDEATSALDSVTEKLILSGIQKIYPKMTVINVAHRLSSLRYCHQIYLMDKGCIVSQGTHDDLVENSELFKRIVNSSNL